MRHKGLFQILLIFASALLMANLGAIIDFYQHPDIPYFDDEHLLAGGVTGLLTVLMFGTIMIYVRRLEKALQKIKILRGMLPICGSCKRIRDDQGYWNQLETYVSEHSEAMFTTGICPDCEKSMYRELENLKATAPACLFRSAVKEALNDE